MLPDHSVPAASQAHGTVLDPTQEELKHREREIAAIRRITGALFSHATVDDMVRETLTVAIEVLQADVGSVQMYDAQHDTLVFQHVMDPRDQHLIGRALPTSQGIGGRVFRTGISDLSNNVSDRTEFNRAVDDLTGYHTESILTVPLQHFAGEPVGIVQVLNARRTFDERDLEVLEVLAAQAAAAIQTAHLVEQARKAELISIIGDISHDIKNLLTPIQSGIQTLQPLLDDLFAGLEAIRHDCPATEPWGDKLAAATAVLADDYAWICEAALDAAERLQSRTKEIANAVKGESAPPVFETSDIHETADAVLRALRPVAEPAHVELKTDYAADLPLIDIDIKQIDNALYNLLNNAIPETPPGGSVTVRTRLEAAEPATVLIEVQDTGRGMPEAVRQRLFTDAAKSTKRDGTGLGTRIVHDVVRRHHGTIAVSSSEGRGTTFSILLPLRQTPRGR